MDRKKALRQILSYRPWTGRAAWWAFALSFAFSASLTSGLGWHWMKNHLHAKGKILVEAQTED